MNGIFKTRQRVIPISGSQPVLIERLKTENLVNDDGILVSSVVRTEVISSNDLESLPDSRDFQLSDMIKQGYLPKEVPTHGLISDTNYNIGALFNDLVRLQDSLKVVDPVVPESSSEPVTEIINN